MILIIFSDPAVEKHQYSEGSFLKIPL